MGHRYLLFTGLAVVALGAAGCGPDLAGTCEAQEACIGGNEADIDACIAVAEGQSEQAHDIGCGAEADALAECIIPLLQCDSQTTGATCASNADCNGVGVCTGGQCSVKFYGVDAQDQDACEAEQNAYSRCN